jgi:hypothetical protein
MTIRRRPLAATQTAGLLALLMREEMAFRCLRSSLAAVLGPGPGAGLSGTLSGFPEPGGSRRPSPNKA